MHHGALSHGHVRYSKRSTQPWGNLREAVQESLELAEAVDLHKLPGLHSLWQRHDLNVQGDAELLVVALPNTSLPLPVCRDPRGGYTWLTMSNNHSWCPILMTGRMTLHFRSSSWANQGLGQ